MSLTIKDSKGNPIIEIGEYMRMPDAVDGPYSGYWITRAEPPAQGEGFFCKADKLVKLLNNFYNKEF